MKAKAKYIGCALMLCLTSTMVHAGDVILLRPQFGMGTLDGRYCEHAGLRLLQGVTDIRRYGLELSRVNSKVGDFISTGIVLEQRLAGWFNMSIGTIAYLGVGQGSRNYPGVVANLGWEPETNGALRPFVTLRNDVLFADSTLSGLSLSVGMGMQF